MIRWLVRVLVGTPIFFMIASFIYLIFVIGREWWENRGWMYWYFMREEDKFWRKRDCT